MKYKVRIKKMPDEVQEARIGVRIKKLPQARMGYQVDGSLKNDIVGLGGADYRPMGKANLSAQKTIKKDPREESNLEAEGGETVLGDVNFDGFPEHFTIKGPRHAQGGVPLKLPEDTFIFSDFREMKIKDPKLLEKFGKVVSKASKQKAYTPAELAKQYDINHYRAILQSPDSDKLDRKTAELMIRNYNMKLGALALAQEAKKGFPQGIPLVAQPFMEANGLSPEDFIPQEEQAEAVEQGQPMMEGQEPVDQATIPQQMPDGSPIAQPQQMDPREMMMAEQMPQEEMPPMPMGQYGMFVPEYNFGGSMYNPFQTGTGNSVGIGMNTSAYNPYSQQSQFENDLFGSGAPSSAPKGPANPFSFINTTGTGSYAETRGTGVTLDNQGNNIIADNANQFKPKQQETGSQDIEVKMKNKDVKEYKTEPWLALGNVTASAFPWLMNTIESAETQKDKKKSMDAMNQFASNVANDPRKIIGKTSLTGSSTGLDFASEQGQNNYGRFEYGGQSLPKANDGKIKKRDYTADELKSRKDKKYSSSKSGEGWIDLGNGEWGRGSIYGKKWEDKGGGGGGTFKGDLNDYIAAICNRMKNGDMKGLTVDEVINDAKAFYSGHSKIAEIRAALAPCQTIDEEVEFYKEEGGKECVCKDKDGNDVVTPLDKDGKCPCEEEITKCYCIDDETGEKKEVPCGEGGTEPDCPAGSSYQGSAKMPASYWIQDTRNTANAWLDRMRLKKYLPWSARPDLEEGRVDFLDPTRQYAALGERASTEAAANAQFAGPQQLAARNAASQAATVQAIGDIGSNINNQNTLLSGQWDKWKTDIRNKENLLRGEAETKDFMGTTIANQQFDNAVTQLDDNLTLAMNTADTNKWKTDALNQMYPNYQVDPSVGGEMYYNPTYKEPNPIKPEDEIAYAQSLKGSGLDPEVQRVMLQNYYKTRGSDNSAAPDPNMIAAMYGQSGGPIMFQDGGFIYMAYPMFL